MPDDVYSRGVRFFQRHVVPIQFEFTPKGGGKPHYVLITSFLVSVRENWLLLTAGHCIDDVRENIEKGCSMRSWFVDCGGVGAKHREMVPFDWTSAMPARLPKESDIDLGLLWVGLLEQAQLAANSVEPFNEMAWDHDPPEPVTVYLMMGLPKALAEPSSPVSTFTPVALAVVPLPERPPELDETRVERWYGLVEAGGGVHDIVGMSGGPILAIATASDGTVKYWLFAIQSAWHRPTRAIAAHLTRPALRALAGEIEQVVAAQEADKGDVQ